MSETDFSQQKLDAVFARARAQRADTSRAEFGFETRLMAEIREKSAQKPGSLFRKMTWRMAPLFAAIVIGLAAWDYQMAGESQDAAGLDLLQHPENADLLGETS